MALVKIGISGTQFEFSRDVLLDKPFQKLPQIVSDAIKDAKPLEFSFERPSGVFTYILSYYQTGELHMPTCVCPGMFEKELEFWGIDTEELAECCYYRYTRYLNDLETQKKFKKETMRPQNASFPMVTVTSSSGLALLRQKVWRVVESNTATLASKLYFGLVIFMVLLSIATLAFSTEPSMRRALNQCEMMEYLKYTNHPQRDFIRDVLGNPTCSGDARSSSSIEININEYDWDKLWDYFYNKYDDYGTDEYDDDDDDDNHGNTTTVNGALSTGNNTTTNDTDYSDVIENVIRNSIKRRIKIPNLTVPLYIFDVLERVTMAFFTLDLLLRLFSCPSIKRYFLSFLNVIDACALVSSYIYVILLSIEKQYRYKDSWVKTLEYLQIFRILRLFRVVQNVRATKVLVYSMWQNIRDITLLGFLLLMAVSLFATVLYFTEDTTDVESIPQAWYWAVVTLTTVGYGDISPTTYPGRFVASLCAVCGVILLAVTLPIFVNNFLVLYDFSCVEEANENRKLTRSLSSSSTSKDSLSGISTPTFQDKKSGDIFFVAPKADNCEK